MRMSQRKGFGKLVFYGSIPTKEDFLEKEKWPFSFSCCLGEKEKIYLKRLTLHTTQLFGVGLVYL